MTESPAAIDQRRSKWLALAKDVALALYEQHTCHRRLCPACCPSDEERATQLRRLATVTSRLNFTCGQLLAVEQGEPPLGVSALIDWSQPQPVRLALVVLIAARLNVSLADQVGDVAQIVELAAGPDGDAALLVREAFRVDTGALRRLVHCIPGRTLDEAHHLVLREDAYTRSLRLPLNREFAELGMPPPPHGYRR